MAAQTYPVAVIAKLLDLTPQRVQQLVKEGVIPREGKGRYEFVPAFAGISDTCGTGRSVSDALPDEAARASRARLIKAQAEAAEMENARTRNELIPRGVVEEELGKVFVAFRSRINSVDTKAPASDDRLQQPPGDAEDPTRRCTKRRCVNCHSSISSAEATGKRSRRSIRRSLRLVAASAEVNDQPVGRRGKAPIV